jgi:amidase
VPFTPIANVTGQPAISLPLTETGDGLPVGVMLTAQTLREDLLLQVAAQLERALPWQGRTPAINAAAAAP